MVVDSKSKEGQGGQSVFMHTKLTKANSIKANNLSRLNPTQAIQGTKAVVTGVADAAEGGEGKVDSTTTNSTTTLNSNNKCPTLITTALIVATKERDILSSRVKIRTISIYQ